MRFDALEDWLAWQQTLHPRTIELGIDRVGRVADRLGLKRPAHTVITVAGTNGKGSSVALLESILHEAGLRIGSYTSPHLLRYNERIRLQRQPVADTLLCRAFGAIDAARAETSLSYFEFATLAAMYVFAEHPVDVAIMEVGLGGRLDAVNALDTDLALITSIGLDHTEWLGFDRESIGHEKAGIMRPGVPAVCSDDVPPASIIHYAADLHAPLYIRGREFHYRHTEDTWSWLSGDRQWASLPLPALYGETQLKNASGVLMALNLLPQHLAVDEPAIRRGLAGVSLAGRFQRLPGEVETILDVAHNPDGGQVLADNLHSLPCRGQRHAVFGLLVDKDAAGIVQPLVGQFDHWYLGELTNERAMQAAQLEALVKEIAGPCHLQRYADMTAAYQAARAAAGPNDRIVVFGSAFTVAEIMPWVV